MGRVVLHLPGGESEKPYVVGTYVGDDKSERLIPLGFEPSAVAVWTEIGEQYQFRINSNENNYYGGLALKGAPCKIQIKSGPPNNILSTALGGFFVYYFVSEGGTYRINTNLYGKIYHYIAFR